MINSKTKLVGLIGNPISHSKSPQMHNAVFEKLYLNYRYLAFKVEPQHLKQAIEGVKAFEIKGLNVTIPFKVDVMPLLDELSEEAKIIGAVNTIVNHSGKLTGYNTDGEGYLRSLTEETGVELENKSVLILGAGGAARAVGYALSRHPLKNLLIANRGRERAAQLISELSKYTLTEYVPYLSLKAAVEKADVIINTTSVGMYPNIEQTLINKEWITPNHLVSDIIYNPLKTRLIKDAKKQGAKIHTGLGMFVYQGLIAFEKWTGITPDPDLMRKTVLKSSVKNIDLGI